MSIYHKIIRYILVVWYLYVRSSCWCTETMKVSFVWTRMCNHRLTPFHLKILTELFFCKLLLELYLITLTILIWFRIQYHVILKFAQTFKLMREIAYFPHAKYIYVQTFYRYTRLHRNQSICTKNLFHRQNRLDLSW